MTYTVTFSRLPETLDELKLLKEGKLLQPEDTAALCVAALCVYPNNKEESFKMLDYLRGPRPLSTMDKQFIADRFMDGKDYIPRSYFSGSTPENNYTPTAPYTVTLSDSHAPLSDPDNYRILDVKSGGADSTRTITLRLKPSTGEWFLWEQTLLAGIREPKEKDAWA